MSSNPATDSVGAATDLTWNDLVGIVVVVVERESERKEKALVGVKEEGTHLMGIEFVMRREEEDMRV